MPTGRAPSEEAALNGLAAASGELTAAAQRSQA